MANPIRLEVPVFSPVSVERIIRSGCRTRLELNAPGSYPQGGTTPAVDTYRQVLLENTDNPIRIMIRPRGPPADRSQDFLYDLPEIYAMQAAMEEWKASGLMSLAKGDGFVFAVLIRDPNSPSLQEIGGTWISEHQCGDLVQVAKPYPCVFHRAFDDLLAMDLHPHDIVNKIVNWGFEGILTSGGGGCAGRAIDNVKELEDIVRDIVEREEIPLENRRNRIQELIVGGGVRGENVKELETRLLLVVADLQLRIVFHSSCLTERSVDGDVDQEEFALITRLLS